MSRFTIAVLALAVAIPIGGVGAWAFNPDSGAVLHSLALWRIFGIMFELGLPLLLIVLIVAAVCRVLRGSHSRRIS
ncbi:MAG: hypothetical protein M3025_00770 [Actinomycetota bacterium]|nr:hypothetical protein [Actinomycetota bacterium]